MNTRIALMYRDGNNYKSFSHVVVAGEIADEQIALIESKLEEGMYCISDQVGLPTPSMELIEKYGYDEESDHVFTTMEDFADGSPDAAEMLTDHEPTVDFDINELVNRFMAIEGWDVVAEMERMR